MNGKRYYCLLKVDNIQLLTRNTIEHASFVVQDNLHQFKFLSKLTRVDVGIDVQDLTISRLCEISQESQLERDYICPFLWSVLKTPYSEVMGRAQVLSFSRAPSSYELLIFF